MTTFREVEHQLNTGLVILSGARLALSASNSQSAARMCTKMAIATENLRLLRNGLHRSIGVVDDANAVATIMRAVSVLNAQRDSINQDPEACAIAYGALFVGAGQLAIHLPPPLDMYGNLLKGFGNFFLQVSAALDPARRPSWAGQFRMAYGEGVAIQRGLPPRGATNL